MEVSTKLSCLHSGALSWLLSVLGLLGIKGMATALLYLLFSQSTKEALSWHWGQVWAKKLLCASHPIDVIHLF